MPATRVKSNKYNNESNVGTNQEVSPGADVSYIS
jgi:hypothetical protein